MIPQQELPAPKPRGLNFSPHYTENNNSMSHFTHTHIGELSSLPELQIYEYGPSENVSRKSLPHTPVEWNRTPRSTSQDRKKAVSIVRIMKNTDPSNFIGLPVSAPEGDEHSCTSMSISPRDHLNVRASAPICGNQGDGQSIEAFETPNTTVR